MRSALGDEVWAGIEAGVFAGPDGLRYQRRSTRTKRAAVDAHVADGVPVLVRLWSAGQLDWHDGPEARDAWAQRRGAVVSPGAKVPRGEVAWTAGVWTDGDAVVVLLDGHC